MNANLSSQLDAAGPRRPRPATRRAFIKGTGQKPERGRLPLASTDGLGVRAGAPSRGRTTGAGTRSPDLGSTRYE